jgi:RHS repeat-associated protein
VGPGAGISGRRDSGSSVSSWRQRNGEESGEQPLLLPGRQRDTSHLASSSGNLLWWFRYDLQGAPIVYNSADNQISDSGFDLHLFTSQRWYSQLGLYDLRNRFYSPDIGRFLQPDPIGFGGDATNLYRYCGNNPVTRSDPTGLLDDNMGGVTLKTEAIQSSTGRVWVFGNGFPSALEHSLGGEGLLGNDPNSVRGDVGSFGDGGGGGGGGLFGGLPVNPFTSPNALADNPFSQNVPFTLDVPPQNPLLPSSFTQLTIGFSWPLPYVGTLFGVQWSMATTPFGQTFYGLGLQINRAPTIGSVSVTVNNLTSRVGTGPAGMTQALTGGSWNVGGGYGVGGQFSWATGTWYQPTSWGGGFFTPQGGIALMYGWQGATPTRQSGGH